MQPRLNLQALGSHLCEQSKCPLPFPTGTTSTDQRAVQHRVRLEQELALGSLRSDCSDLVFLLGLPWHASSRQCRASGACCYKSPKLAPNIHVHRRHALPKRTKSRQGSTCCFCILPMHGVYSFLQSRLNSTNKHIASKAHAMQCAQHFSCRTRTGNSARNRRHRPRLWQCNLSHQVVPAHLGALYSTSRWACRTDSCAQ